MKKTVLGYENGYIVAGQFTSAIPFTGEYTPVKVRVSIEGSHVIREYQEPGKRNYTRILNQPQP